MLYLCTKLRAEGSSLYFNFVFASLTSQGFPMYQAKFWACGNKEGDMERMDIHSGFSNLSFNLISQQFMC
jgi:hypothetical protein